MAMACEDVLANSKKTYFCSFDGCEMTFDRPSRLQWHFRNHTGERPYKCDVDGCEKAYATSTKLKRHVKTFHKSNGSDITLEEQRTQLFSPEADGDNPEPNRDKAVEKNCQSAFDDDGGNDSDKEYKFKCLEPGCGKSFKRRANLYNHRVLMHEKRANHRCTVEGCDKVFTFPNLLKRHMKSHQGYQCKQCPEIFYKWSEVRKHVSTEHRKVHCCPSCSKTFQRPCDLHRHELTHSGNKQIYACTAQGCQKSYDRVATLRKHIKAQHHKELPFKCELCVAAFPNAADLKRHIKYHEKKEAAEKKSYPAKGHRKVPLIDRLLGPLPLPSTALSSSDGLTCNTPCDVETHLLPSIAQKTVSMCIDSSLVFTPTSALSDACKQLSVSKSN